MLGLSTSLVDLTKNQSENGNGRLRKTSKNRAKRLSSERIAELFAVGLTYSKHVFSLENMTFVDSRRNSRNSWMANGFSGQENFL